METPRSASPLPLEGMRILVVEDDPILAIDMEATLVRAGAEVIGPVSHLPKAFEFATHQTLSVALLDVRLGDQSVEPAAQLLAARGIPIVFYTGQPLPFPLQKDWPRSTTLYKPATTEAIIDALARSAATASPLT
ncbi:response regulator [Marinivivus vitaminiproducens]|uniref:response regulator n=1 Tax=Marinivivus vitaminiproducens TaxID=3035935 RepID=UPI0027A9B2A5|nr:hypothetical protein P4R82_04790 [Geminicoccaceae bacterium SCSIO 64248]